MPFCTNCGEKIVEGQAHLCSAAVQQTGSAGSKIDTALLIQLLKNPQSGLSLHPEKDLMNGFIGIGTSILGFFMFAWALKKQLLDSMFGSMDSVFSSDLIGSAARSAGNRVPFASNMLWLGAISLLVLLAILALVGNWQGQRKLGWREVVTYLGSMQLLSGAGFLLTAIIAFVSIKVAFVLLTVNLLTTLLLTIISALEIYQVRAEQRLVALGSSITVYAIIVLLASSLLLKSAFSTIL